MPYKDAAKRRAYQKEYNKKHYLRNKQMYVDKAKKSNAHQRSRNKSFVNRYKSFISCVDCGESNSIVLEFDHVRGEKVANISDMVNMPHSISSIKKEIRKCDPCCANCHRIRTHQRRQ